MGVNLSCLEQISYGITCYNDMYYFMDETARATKEMGLRAFLSAVIFDKRPELLTKTEPFVRCWQGDDLVTPTICPHAAYTCSSETRLKTKEIAHKYNTIVHIHVSETRQEFDGFNLGKGMSPVKYLHKLGLLNGQLIAVHCVWLSREDAYLLAKLHANVVDCTVSNLKLSSGIAP